MTSLFSSYLYSFYIPTLLTSLLLYIAISLVISIFFTSLYSLLLYSLTSLLSSHLYTLDISIFISFAIFPYNRVLTSCYYLINYNFGYVYIFENESLLALADIYTAKESIFFTYDFVIHNLVTYNLVTHIFLAFYYLFYHAEFFFFANNFFVCRPYTQFCHLYTFLPPNFIIYKFVRHNIKWASARVSQTPLKLGGSAG